MTAIILGDPHLGKSGSIAKPGIGTALNSRVVDQFNILEWVLLKAIDYFASEIIITGDVFEDTKPSSTVMSLFVSWLKKCTDNDVNVHIIAGNHEILRSGQFYTSPLDIISAADIDGVYIYKHISTFHTKGVSYTFLPFRDRRSFNVDVNSDALKMLSDKIPYELSEIDLNSKKVLVGHLAIKGSIPVGDEIDDMKNELFCPVQMFKGYDYVWMGHVHKPQIMNKKNPFVAHIGSMEVSDFGEVNHKKHIVIFNSDKTDPVQYVEIPTRPLHHISITVPENITDTTNFIISQIKDKYNSLSKSIVKLTISLENPDTIGTDRSAIEKCLTDLGVFHISRISEERKIVAVKQLEEGKEIIDNTVNEMTAIKMFADTNVDISIKDDFIVAANEIITEYKEKEAV